MPTEQKYSNNIPCGKWVVDLSWKKLLVSTSHTDPILQGIPWKACSKTVTWWSVLRSELGRYSGVDTEHLGSLWLLNCHVPQVAGSLWPPFELSRTLA
ncbi:hypothetical protein Scep_001271 [Stephania cephalantha]|uniref:Uncharacterized protein n=1 Tax=Stephania cephalantha TaxID=152367 RepID=A0AAP0LAE8_9MAGN